MAIGQKIKQFRQEKGWSQQRLADEVLKLTGRKIGQTGIAAIESGATKRSKWLPEIARALDKRLKDLDSTLPNNETGGGEPLPAHGLRGERDLPVYAAAEGGDGAMILSAEAIDFVRRPTPLESVRGGYGILLIGTSMEPAYEAGDILLVHPHLAPIPNTDVVLYREEHGMVTVCAKRLRRATEDHWLLTQWNPPEGQARDFSLPRALWPICHRIVGKYNRR